MTHPSDQRAPSSGAGQAGPGQNQILAKLPPPELAQITANAKRIFCKIQQVLFEQGSIIKEVYFPLTGLASMVVVLSDGTTIEALTIGREGFVGVPLIHDVPTARYRGVCQVEGEFLVMDAQVFLGMIGSLSDLRRRLLRYSQYASEVAAQSVACNSVHMVEQRCARWLLITADATGTTDFRITHEFLSQMLAVTRPGVTVALQRLVKQGLVETRYGRIRLLDIAGLENVACECYATVRSKAEELL